jgi:hypothetical protein
MDAVNQNSPPNRLNHNSPDHRFWNNVTHHNGFLQEDQTDFLGFFIGSAYGPQVVAVNATAQASLDLGLQTAIPADSVSIHVSFDDVVDVAGFGRSAASGTVESHATSQAEITLGHGVLNGTFTALLSIAVSASIPSAHATVQMQITESFQLSLSGQGFVGASITHGAASSGTVVAPAADAGGTMRTTGNTFDLAGFAGSVLSTGHWDIAFMGLAPGESLHAMGTSEMAIIATAEVAGYSGPEKLNLHDTDRSSFVVNERSGPGGGTFGMQPYSSGQLGPLHTL